MKENTEVVQFNFLIYPVRKKAQSHQSKSEGELRLEPGLRNLSGCSALQGLGCAHDGLSGAMIWSPVPTEGPEKKLMNTVFLHQEVLLGGVFICPFSPAPTCHAGSQFPEQGLNPGQGSESPES